ncbi:hypothetical protein H696_01832 [Fonticula alba]|uniref:Kazal-like domain-containing protein n=1 Tax=Fonticula alba TaxID=691883 RepID=A0A058Z9D5_FONAL|nr:hypothetical protein H696_01832 [Fonticula alba]KCV70885.1 hypothetical protein H696_01832 [Fonticula alba]|eukprot:XP_009494008.1 hypothetical protein H696_01832 [Fonticula alba]
MLRKALALPVLLLALAAASLGAGQSAGTDEPGCMSVCPPPPPDEAGPICGTDYKEYSSLCEMNRTACLKSMTIDVLVWGSCPREEGQNECDIYCDPADSAPAPGQPDSRVCGSDGVTYGSPCIVERVACVMNSHLPGSGITVAYTGPCQSDTGLCASLCAPLASNMCQRNCPAKNSRFDRVCGSDGKTYASACHLAESTCLSYGEVTYVKTGTCNPSWKPEHSAILAGILVGVAVFASLAAALMTRKFTRPIGGPKDPNAAAADLEEQPGAGGSTPAGSGRGDAIEMRHRAIPGAGANGSNIHMLSAMSLGESSSMYLQTDSTTGFLGDPTDAPSRPARGPAAVPAAGPAAAPASPRTHVIVASSPRAAPAADADADPGASSDL